jgi:hypothetical protein
MSQSVRYRAYSLAIFDEAPKTLGIRSEWDGHGRGLPDQAKPPTAMSARRRILYVRLRTYRLYFVALHSGVNHPLRVGFPEGSFSNGGPSTSQLTLAMTVPRRAKIKEGAYAYLNQASTSS